MKYNNKLVLTDWCFNNCVWNKCPDGFKPWGYAVTKTDNFVSVYNCFWCNIIGETEKAYNIEFEIGITNHHCDIIRTLIWHLWIPKSQIIKDEIMKTFDGGRIEQLNFYLTVLESANFTIKKRR